MAYSIKTQQPALADPQLLQTLADVAAHIIHFDEVKKAFDLNRLLEEKLEKKKSEMRRLPEVYSWYKKIAVKLRLIALPLLDQSDIIDIFKNYFTWQFRLPDYDVLAKLEAKFLTIIVMEERDEFKNKLQQALLENSEVIASHAETKTIQDWLKNYNAAVGTGPADSLKRNQYLAGLKSNKSLADYERQKLQTLTAVYELCKLSSFTPQGFEETVPISIDGKLYIFDHGVLEQVKPSKQVEEILRASERLPSTDTIVERSPALQKMAEQYPPGSLERRAIEEEIAKNSKTKKP